MQIFIDDLEQNSDQCCQIFTVEHDEVTVFYQKWYYELSQENT